MAKHNVTFNGENASGGYPLASTFLPTGKKVSVELDDETAERLSKNPEFTVSEVAAKAA